MSEKYLKWLLLRNIVGEWIRLDMEMSVYVLEGTTYNVEKMKQDYIRLTKELLKDYEIPIPKQDESGNGVQTSTVQFVSTGRDFDLSELCKKCKVK